MRIDDWFPSQGSGPVDVNTLRVVFGAGQTFIQEDLPLKTPTIVTQDADASTVREIQVLDPAIHKTILFNDADRIAVVKLGPAASLIDFSFKLAIDERFTLPFRYTGQITALWLSGVDTSGKMRVTNIRE